MLGTLGQTPWSARDALVPQPEQRYQHYVNASRPTGASAADQGVCPTICADVQWWENEVALRTSARATSPFYFLLTSALISSGRSKRFLGISGLNFTVSMVMVNSWPATLWRTLCAIRMSPSLR